MTTSPRECIRNTGQQHQWCIALILIFYEKVEFLTIRYSLIKSSIGEDFT